MTSLSVAPAGTQVKGLDTSTCRLLNFRGIEDAGVGTFDYELPGHLEAGEPPEARGLRRDQVKLMVSHYAETTEIEHTRFEQIGAFLQAGDVLVINVSGTLNAAVEGEIAGEAVHLHLSTKLAADRWVVEVRQPTPEGTVPRSAAAGQLIRFTAGGEAKLLRPYRPNSGEAQHPGSDDDQVRLWVADITGTGPLEKYLEVHGFPIRYGYVQQSWPSHFYQTVYATEPGSAEMPSAGRAFSAELITHLVARGVHIAPLVLHTGVASLEDHEPPYAEWYRVPATTAQLVRQAQRDGHRVVAVGTTAVRALETVTDAAGIVQAGEGWTDLINRIGWDEAGDVLSSLVGHLCRSQRAEETNAWRSPVDLKELLLPHLNQLGQLMAESEATTWQKPEGFIDTLLGEDPAAIVESLDVAVSSGATPLQLAGEVAYAAALRVARFHVQNEFIDWIGVLHTFSYANALQQLLKRHESAELLRGVYHGALRIYLDRFLNVPPARLPSKNDSAAIGDEGSQGAGEAALSQYLDLLNRQQQVDEAGRLVYDYVAAGHDTTALFGALAESLVREDAEFHSYQMLEAAIRQHAERSDAEEQRHVLVAAARYLAAHAPTQRSMLQTLRIALRLHRGDPVFEEE
ncbi:MAG: S-adenosylmethionine:tRNA ribosyltransferase-isomerase [Gemmatimonadetes bacterium]|jgi:S-adenosylmethionine:tRNA ribosyltransferase-isomerase|nr:S-adenosylmethionine:tRNA ribosyltransferase-isomerase [Gemmatimonadota bacterium]MBT5142369.1 S-adenosylmethionine:tRNA ribosyltransferase-isomerase [Gemmatimonadota bacterium]MBT5588426.1 S-adenosylmethionine:tRNA ribosyltransferase-isomerase [Gemmatimonadota bacterium]MBT5962627.1 S-adenosylmethionine:tRNA ribosyltransferase-isomerase [Gemmatimonadota bacterium]MBT7457134.1 S-adenosylmethionine:tRNA ribosyltransferase-isomerase [Gemmatimonadota bacterium]